MTNHWRDVATQALSSGDWLVRDMQSEEGDPHESWTVKRNHDGRFTVFYTGRNHKVTALFDSLEELASGKLEDGGYVDVPPDIVTHAHYALEALDAKKLREKVVQAVVMAWKGRLPDVPQST